MGSGFESLKHWDVSFFIAMNYKDILTKINIEISENDRAAARAFLLSEKKTGKAAAAVWSDIISRFGSDIAGAGSDSPIFDDIKPGKQKSNKTTTKTGKARKKENKTVIKENNDRVEIYSGDVVGGSSVPGDDFMVDIEKKIENAISDFCIRYEIDGIQGLKKSKQTTFAALCTYIGRHCFKGTNILKSSKMYPTNNGGMSTNNKYDIEKVAAVLNYCLYLCGVLDKTFLWWNGTEFCGLNIHFISDHAEELTRAGFDVYKNTENSLNTSMLSAQNSMAYIATLNHRFNWSNTAAASPAPAVNVTVYPVLNTPSAAPALPDNSEM